MTITELPKPDPHADLQPISSTTNPKPGYLTTEFWLKIAAMALTALFASGVIPTSGPAAQVAAIAATMLGALGYTVGRSLVKAASTTLLLLALGTGIASTTACGATTKAADKAVIADVVDCSAPDRAKLEAQFGPAVEQAVQRATGLDGKVDLPSLQTITKSLEADGWCVVEKAATELIAAVMTKATGTSAAFAQLDAKDLAAKLAALRVGKFGATQFQLSAAPQ